MVEKAVNGVKNVSREALSAACHAALSVGAADALMAAGFALFLTSIWIRSRIMRPKEAKCES